MNSAGLSPKDPNKYLGPNVYVSSVVVRNRRPTGADYRQPETGKLYPNASYWLIGSDPTTGVQGELWYLSKIVANVAYWLLLGSGSVGPLLDIQVQVATAPGVNPVTPTLGGLITINGVSVAAHSVPIETRTRALNTFNIEVQYASAVASTDATKSGLAHFNSSQFAVDANGFVTLSGGGEAIDSLGVQATSGAGTNPVVSDVNGKIEMQGALVAAGTNPLRAVSTAANTLQYQVQTTQAIAATDATKVGLANFNSAQFTVDANGFVSTSGTGIPNTITGNSGGALSPTAGNWNIFGASTAAGTSPVSTSGSVSTLTVNVQKSQAIAATDATKVGLANFDSASFNVDANGFVTLVGSGFTPTSVINISDDFINASKFTSAVSTSTSIASSLGWGHQNLNVLAATENGHPGILSSVAGLTANANAWLWAGQNSAQAVVPSIVLGGGTITLSWVIKIENLSDVTNRYILRCGLGDTYAIANPTDQVNGVYFEYSDDINSGDWNYKTASASSRTTGNSSTAVTTGWHNLTMTINAAASSISFTVDGVSLGAAITTDIPTAAISPIFYLGSTAGTIPTAALLIDLFYMTQTLTTPR